jgi:hypothetical protein
MYFLQMNKITLIENYGNLFKQRLTKNKYYHRILKQDDDEKYYFYNPLIALLLEKMNYYFEKVISKIKFPNFLFIKNFEYGLHYNKYNLYKKSINN